jgi:MFS family permease
LPRLAGRVCVVNGAASVIGQAVAGRFTSEGGVVVGVDQVDHGVGQLAVQADLADEARVEAMYEQVVREYGRLDVIYNNMGLASQAACTATYFAVLFTLALYLQQGLGKSAAYSGLALVSWVAAFGIPGPVLGRLPGRARALAAPAGSLILAAGFAGLAACLLAGNTSGIVLITLLGVAGLGLGIAFTGMLSHLTGSVSGEHAAALSGLFNTATRAGGVIGTAAFGTLYLALVHHPGQAVHGFAVLNLALAATVLAAAVMAAVSVRQR